MWNLGGLTWGDLGGRVWSELSEDRILGRAAQLAFYFLLSIFPLLLVVIALVGALHGGSGTAREALVQYVGSLAPDAAGSLVDAVLMRTSVGSSAGSLSLGLAATLWAASSGVVAVGTALNTAYEVEESRVWWKRRLVALALTGVLMLLILAALLLTVYGAGLGARVASGLGLGDTFLAVWSVLRWPVMLGFVLVAFNLLYLYAPNVRQREWDWLMPGTVVGVALWLLASAGLKGYIAFYGPLGSTYGPLGSAVVLLLWFYVTGVALLVGGEVNSEIQRAARRAGRAESPNATEART